MKSGWMMGSETVGQNKRLMRPPQADVRRAAEARGRDAESLVAAGWQARGYDILARRLRTQAGEIDLIVANAATLLFVEVKARRSLDEAAYALQPRQQQRLLRAAETAVATHETWQRPEMRFDVALVCGGTIDYIEDAIRGA